MRRGAAAELAKRIPERGKESFALVGPMLTVFGDEAMSLDSKQPEQEQIAFTILGGKTIDENSPVLIIGDSNTLVLATGDDMLAKAGGLAKRLELNLKMLIDRISRQGIGGAGGSDRTLPKRQKKPALLKSK